MKRNFFRATIESVLIYDSVSWTLTKSLEKRLNGNYTRMLRTILNRSWKYHPNNKDIYGNIPDILMHVNKTATIAFFWSLLDIQIGTGIGCYNLTTYSW